jgi:hypothetical protein
VRLGKIAARREVESLQSIEVRNAAFVEISVALEEVRLTDMTIANAQVNGAEMLCVPSVIV